jgi:DNA-binding response OmpR family regulator
MEGKPTVLVVEGRRWLRDSIARWLEDAGMDVMVCPGPSAPGYQCTGTRGNSCVLAKVADAVVLDLRLRSDEAHRGVPAFELMWAYGNLGKPLVLLKGPSDPVVPFPDGHTQILRRPPTRSELVAAVEAVIPAASAATPEEA